MGENPAHYQDWGYQTNETYINLLLFTLILCLIAEVAFKPLLNRRRASTNWPQWRGPDSQGVSNDKNLPTEWSETKNVLWKTALPGKGFSQPIIWGKSLPDHRH